MRRADKEVTDRQGREEILKACKTCHLGMVDDGIPYVVPLSYGYELREDGTLELYFHSAGEGRKIDILRKNNQVCFEMSQEGEAIHADTPCDYGYYYYSLIGNGRVCFVEDVQEKCKALSCIFYHQMGQNVEIQEKQASAVCIFKIVSKDYTGKREEKK